MSVARCVSRAQIGLQAPLVEIEVHLGSGLPSFSIVGLPAAAVKESKERVRSALVNARFEFPAGRITVNLAPADVPKDGGRFDLPIALGILVASGQLAPVGLERTELYGELGLGGELKPVRGLLLAASHAAREHHAMIVPQANAAEVTLPVDSDVYPAMHLLDVHGHLAQRRLIPRCNSQRPSRIAATVNGPDIADVRGQVRAKRALLIAAAGAHSLLMVGPPGSGKSLLAQRLPDLLPALEPSQALEVASIAAVSGSGFDPERWGLRPYRAPHHTASAHAIIGGGPRAQPGEVSLAHHGVLFLDEFPEFDRRVLEGLREPLEAGSVAISRATAQAIYPARFQLVAAMNPCPCGWYGEPNGDCHCGVARTARYRERLSGPLLDRIDLRIAMSGVTQEELLSKAERSAATTASLAAQVRAARDLQLERAGRLNAFLDPRDIERWCELGAEAEQIIERSYASARLSARAVHRVLRVARTLADLEGVAKIESGHVAEALHLRRALEPEGASAPNKRALT